MTRVSAIQTGCILAVTFALLGANCSPQSDGHAVEAGPSMPGIYLPPNEQHPAVALPIYRKSNHGVYVSVGTERSFIGAALTSAKALYVIDYDLLAVRFAKVNRALLAASTSRADYVNLRLTAAQDVWQKRSQHLSGEDKETLASLDSWAFWEKKVRKSWAPDFGHFHTAPQHPNDPFFAADYLFDDRLYRHLSASRNPQESGLGWSICAMRKSYVRCAMISNRKAFLWVSSIRLTCQWLSPVRASQRIT